MSDDHTIVAQTREESGKGPVGRLRKEGLLPGSLSRPGKEAHAIQFNMHDFEMLLTHHSGESMILDMQIDGKKAGKALLREVQYGTVHGELLHADFVEVSMDKAIKVSVAIEVTGDAPGVKLGGVLTQLIHEVEIECLPADMVESITVDISELEMEQSLSVADLTAPKGVTILTSEDVGVVNIAKPRVAAAAADDDAEAGEGSEETAEEAAEGDGESGD